MNNFADLTHHDVERILGIVDRLNDIEVRIEMDGMKLHVRKFGDASRAVASPVIAPPPSPSQAQPQSQLEGPAFPPPAVPDARPVQDAAPISAPATSASSGPPAASEPGLVEVRAPMLGRLFRASSPSEPPYVEVGSKVLAEDTVCMLEVMKLFNTVKAGVSGTIVEILAENGAMIEHDAVLFRVRPE